MDELSSSLVVSSVPLPVFSLLPAGNKKKLTAIGTKISIMVKGFLMDVIPPFLFLLYLFQNACSVCVCVLVDACDVLRKQALSRMRLS